MNGKKILALLILNVIPTYKVNREIIKFGIIKLKKKFKDNL